MEVEARTGTKLETLVKTFLERKGYRSEVYESVVRACRTTGVHLLDELSNREICTYAEFAMFVADEMSLPFRPKVVVDEQGGEQVQSVSDVAIETSTAVYTYMPWIVLPGGESGVKPVVVVPKNAFIEATVVYGEAATRQMEIEENIYSFYTNLLVDAVQRNATDIHIDPQPEYYIILMRIDGDRRRVVELPRSRGLSLVRYIVTRCEETSSVRQDMMRYPQDGRLEYVFMDRRIDLRVAFLPTVYGTKVTIRLLKTEPIRDTLEGLGFLPESVQILKRVIKKSHGLVIVTGPTGSGKSRTIATLLSMLDRERNNVLTIEDPVEYMVRMANQSQVFQPSRAETASEYTFADGARAFLRHDPDICLVGEIRDAETAATAVELANTGHLVFSTLHTNTASMAPSRILTGRLGRLVDPVAFAECLLLVLAQRLTKKLCPNCKRQVELTRRDFDDYLVPEEIADRYVGTVVHTASSEGCDSCYLGYQGRTVVEELLLCTQPVKDLIVRNSPAHAYYPHLSVSFYSSVLEKSRRGIIDIYNALSLL